MKTYSVSTAINLCCAYQLSPVKDVESFDEFILDRIHDTESGETLYAEVIDEKSEKSIGEQVRLYAQWCELVAPISNGGPYPTIEEYFSEFVPIDYFVKHLRKMIEDYIGNVIEFTPKNLTDALHHASVLNTFLHTLSANIQRQPLS